MLDAIEVVVLDESEWDTDGGQLPHDQLVDDVRGCRRRVLV